MEPFSNHLLLVALRAPADLRNLSPRGWDLLLRLARRARLLARLSVLVEEAGVLDAVPQQAAANLRGARVYSDQLSQLAWFELERVAWALGELADGVIALKGSAYLMSHPHMARGRLLSDIDLMTPRERLPVVEARLAEHGWAPTKISDYDQAYYRNWMHELPPMRHPEREMEVDLHHTITPLTGRLNVDAAELLAGAVPSGHGPYALLSPEDRTLHCALHLFHDGEVAEAIRDLVDFDLLLRALATGTEFATRLCKRAARLDLLVPLYWSARYAHRLLLSEAAAAVLDVIDYRPSATTVARMDWAAPRALLTWDPDRPRADVEMARLGLYVRSHWLRMPPLMLAKHLGYKAWLGMRNRPQTPIPL